MFIIISKHISTNSLRDHEQYVISEIKSYPGDPLTRAAIEFEILFNFITLTWIAWNIDIFDPKPYENFSLSHSELHTFI